MTKETSKLALIILAALGSAGLTGCPPASGGPPPAGFGITATTKRHTGGGELRIDGQKFTPGGGLKITFVHIPNRDPTDAGARIPDIAPDGSFTYSEPFNCTSHDASEEDALVFVSACDTATGRCASANVRAGSIWVNIDNPGCN